MLYKIENIGSLLKLVNSLIATAARTWHIASFTFYLIFVLLTTFVLLYPHRNKNAVKWVEPHFEGTLCFYLLNEILQKKCDLKSGSFQVPDTVY